MGTPGKASPEPDAREVVGRPADWRNQLKNWYVDKYISEQEDEARPPSRSDDVDAAHAAFPDWNFGREVVWGLRRKHAPKEWKKPGAPQKGQKII